jgi:hypothetical protein
VLRGPGVIELRGENNCFLSFLYCNFFFLLSTTELRIHWCKQLLFLLKHSDCRMRKRRAFDSFPSFPFLIYFFEEVSVGLRWHTLVFSLLSLFKKMSVGLCDHHAVCVSESRSNNFWMREPIFMKLGMCTVAPEPISAAYFINSSHQSVSVCVSLLLLLGRGSVKCIPFIARQRLGKHVPAVTSTRNHRRIVGRLWLWACLSLYPPIVVR